ncbi:MAG: hypothetical protein WC497_00210 [Patescibacteria group bacterium]
MNVTVVSSGQRSLLEALRQQHHFDKATTQLVSCHPGTEATDGILSWLPGQPLHTVAGIDTTRWLILIHCGRCLTAEEIRAFPTVVQIFPGPIEFLRADLDEVDVQGVGIQAAILRYLELTKQDSGHTCVTVLWHSVDEASQIVSVPISEVWVPVFLSAVDPEELMDELWSREALELIHLKCGRTALRPLPANRIRQADFTRTKELEVALRFGKDYALRTQAA